MAKEKERKLARLLFVDQGKTAKDISALIGVTEATLSKWVKDGRWKDLRSAKISSPAVRTDNIKQIINQLTDDRISYSAELKEAEHEKDAQRAMELHKQIACIDDAVSKWNKTLSNIDKESQISLAVYLQVMEMIFESMRINDESLFFKTIDFQESHLNDISLRFK